MITQLVCVVVPIYKQYDKLNATETICWQQCLKVLKNYPFCIASPDNLELTDYFTDLAVAGIVHHAAYFAPRYFSSIDGYNQLMLSRKFFAHFEQYEYLFLCQLDVFVFKDELRDWCAKGYSYIGPPWFEGYHPASPETARLWKVGNGGVTLRRVSDARRALRSFALAQDWATVVKEHFRPGRLYGYTRFHKLLKALVLGNNTHWALNDFHRHRLWYQEDYFWGVICEERFSWYTVPTPEQALAFGFEVQPAVMFELNQRRLPMACHAWEKYGFDFWKPIIEQYGYQLA